MIKTEIILKTIELIEKSKTTEFTSRRIATHCGVNQAMINYYFGSKRNLLTLAMKTTVENTFPPLIKKIETKEYSPKKIINLIVKYLLTEVQNYPNISKYHFKSLFEENKMNYAVRKYIELFQVLERILLKHVDKSSHERLKSEIRILFTSLISVAVFPTLLKYKDIKEKNERVNTITMDLTRHIKQLF